jgi:trk system potassium uptake protein TrkA
VVGRRIEELDLPKGATIGTLVRRHKRATGREKEGAPVYDYEVLMAHHDLVIEPEDHVIVFVVNKRIVPKVEKLFQVNVSFL